jgi:hypothetical protein
MPTLPPKEGNFNEKDVSCSDCGGVYVALVNTVPKEGNFNEKHV